MKIVSYVRRNLFEICPLFLKMMHCKKRLATFPPMESLVSDIPAGDGENANLFYSVCFQFLLMVTMWTWFENKSVNWVHDSIYWKSLNLGGLLPPASCACISWQLAPQIFLTNPDPQIWNPGSGYGRPINFTLNHRNFFKNIEPFLQISIFYKIVRIQIRIRGFVVGNTDPPVLYCWLMFEFLMTTCTFLNFPPWLFFQALI